MYVNFKLLLDKELEPEDVMLLVACKQNQNGELSDVIEKSFGHSKLWFVEQKGYIDYVKGKKGQSDFEKIRLSKKGKDLLDELETPEVTSDDLRIYSWLETIYKESERVVGNRKKTKMYIAQFRVQSQIEKNCLAYLCKSFIEDEDNMKFNLKLEYMFFKPETVYATRFDLEQSRLYKFYLKHQNHFDNEFKKLK